MGVDMDIACYKLIKIIFTPFSQVVDTEITLRMEEIQYMFTIYHSKCLLGGGRPTLLASD